MKEGIEREGLSSYRCKWPSMRPVATRFFDGWKSIPNALAPKSISITPLERVS